MAAYFPMSTANPTGHRPWNFAMQGLGVVRLARKRRRAQLRGLGMLGDTPDPDTLSELQANGYPAITLQQLVAQGASDSDLLNLPYGPGTSADDMGAAIYSLQQSLGGAPGSAGVPASQMQTSIPGAIYGATQTPAAQAALFSLGPIGAISAAYGSQPPAMPPSMTPVAGSSNSGSPSACPAFGQPGSFQCFLQQNWILIALGVGIVVLGPEVLKTVRKAI